MSLGNVIGSIAGGVPTADLTYMWLNASGTNNGSIQLETSSNASPNSVLTGSVGRLNLSGATGVTSGASGITIGANDLTISSAGRYLVEISAALDPFGGTSTPSLQLVHNGANILTYGTSGESGNDAIHETLNLSWIGDLGVGDTLDARMAVEGSFQVEVYSQSVSVIQLSEQTVVPSSYLATNDQAANNYIDLGETRIQWGRTAVASNTGTVTLPAAFNSSDYSITGSVDDGSLGRVVTVDRGSQTSTTFSYLISNPSGSSEARTFQWTAIGRK